jgi:hypothetical protein
MIRNRRRPHRKPGIKGSFIVVGLGLVIIILLGYYLLNKVLAGPENKKSAPIEQVD